jgi:molybdate transport system substrate-binding protein
MGPRGTFALACILGALGALPQSATGAAELVVLANPGAMPGLRELAAAFSRETGHKVTIIQGGVPELERRLAANEPGDLISANPEGIEDLLNKGKVVAGTAVPFQVAGLGLSVRAGVPKPDISTIEAYKATLLNARSIGYSHGCSGTNAAKGIDELGLTERLKAKTVFADNGPVVEYLARGDFELGIQQTNIMVGAPGTEYVGELPGFLNKPCVSTVALLPSSKGPEAARELIKFIGSPRAAPFLRKTLVEPANP